MTKPDDNRETGGLVRTWRQAAPELLAAVAVTATALAAAAAASAASRGAP